MISRRITVNHLIVPNSAWLQKGLNVPKTHSIHCMKEDLSAQMITEKIGDFSGEFWWNCNCHKRKKIANCCSTNPFYEYRTFRYLLASFKHWKSYKILQQQINSSLLQIGSSEKVKKRFYFSVGIISIMLSDTYNNNLSLSFKHNIGLGHTLTGLG